MNESKPEILIADDDEILREFIEYRLTGHGYQVHCAGDGREALRVMQAERPTLVVQDGMMPYIDGFEVLRRIRQDHDLESMPVLMLSVRKQEDDIGGALQSGANDYLVKPFMAEELLARIARLLDGKRSG